MARRAVVDSAIFSRRLLRGAHVLDRPLPACPHDGGLNPFCSSQSFSWRTLDVGYPVETAKLDYSTSFKLLSPYMLWNF